ncbi:MAG: FeoB-associated Cys-rich membrane protein [Clostridia bacterium]|nr:FeoB-associated Cys-rich membrane protein [Clostridia bacterium]MBR7141502.1 FeoB-associated Cys-rich membrane protein [Clostridia bacterium]
MAWFLQNLPSIILAVILFSGLIAIVFFSFFKKKKSGGCHGDCTKCSCCHHSDHQPK